jgi:hypothetical protein
MKSVPSALADGLKTQLDVDRGFVLSPAKAGLGFLGEVIPGLRSLRSLTRGYYPSPLRGSLTQTSRLTPGRLGVINIGRYPTSPESRCIGMFRNLIARPLPQAVLT